MNNINIIQRYDALGLKYKIFGHGNIALIRNKISLPLRNKLLTQFNGICPVCEFIGIPAQGYLQKHYIDNNGEVFHFDHIIPKCMGGTDNESNIRLICPSCNRQKGGRYAQSNT